MNFFLRLYFLPLLFWVNALSAQQFTTPFELSKGTKSPPYTEIIDWWKSLDIRSSKIKMFTMGMTDSNFPLHLVLVSRDGIFDFNALRAKNTRVILINNGIHPGEPDGIDASMLLVRDIVTNKIQLPSGLVLAIIPVYNIGGCLDRSKDYRVDQNGPEEFGFRGNAQNLDLNRDFIKCDSRDARAFADIFHKVDPDVFIDNHVSNGADYQHVMTLICSQHNKLGGVMGEFMNKKFEPGIYSLMKTKGYDLIPYVNAFGDKPDNGWPEFWDGPRYSSGFASLWHCFAFVPETHMLKPYDQRVKATYDLLLSFIDFTSTHGEEIKKLRTQTKQNIKIQKEFTIQWDLDRNQFSERLYKGYEAGYKPSEVSGLPRLYYDRTKPYEKTISFYNQYRIQTTLSGPQAYIIPQGWWKVIELLKLNRVHLSPFKRDTAIRVEVYHIEDYKPAARPFEMHHPNTEVKTRSSFQWINFRKGDCYIPMNQEANRFLFEVLEPKAADSYFTWNFFDAVLGQKEGYSAYAFEDIAADYLKNHPELREMMDQKKAYDTLFAKSGRAQLNFVYEHSPWYEPAYRRYPVFRVN
ncbi:MAG: M14 family zinc carboxypeptidase [Saprospiraceae bacterium]|nr:M14 family zinc carboxypeptidase [Saprospiraceae bacterium]